VFLTQPQLCEMRHQMTNGLDAMAACVRRTTMSVHMQHASSQIANEGVKSFTHQHHSVCQIEPQFCKNTG
jgi:hypothetical protein